MTPAESAELRALAPALASRLRRIASGEWTLKGDEGYLVQAADLILALLDERDRMAKVIEAAKAMRAGTDCPMCDNGKLRNPAKEHWDTCGYAAFDAALAELDKK